SRAANSRSSQLQEQATYLGLRSLDRDLRQVLQNTVGQSRERQFPSRDERGQRRSQAIEQRGERGPKLSSYIVRVVAPIRPSLLGAVQPVPLRRRDARVLVLLQRDDLFPLAVLRHNLRISCF